MTTPGRFLGGWLNYYQPAAMKTHLKRLDRWIRRRLRQVRLKQCKRVYTIATFLQQQGLPEWRAWLLALSSKGWWRMAGSPQAAEAMPQAWFTEQGLISLADRYARR